MSHSKRSAARLLARQAANTCGSESLRAATKLTLSLLPCSHEAIASTPPGSMQRPAGSSGTSASCRKLLGST
eukprot:scaffold33950_cov78-Phaeocystis_antarctica.AAC.7